MLQTVAVVGLILLGIYGLNRLLLQENTAPSDAQVQAAKRYLARHGLRYRLHDCSGSATDTTRILCGARTPSGRDLDLRIDFLPSGEVASTCVAGTSGCS